MKHRQFFIVPLLTVLFLLSGCATNVVYLSYPADSKHVNTVTPSRGTIYVVDFTNNRNRMELGARKNGTPILPRTNIERWAASGLGEEMRRAGYTVIMTETMEEALAGSPKYILTGEIEEAWLAEPFLARYTATIRANIVLCTSQGERITSSSHTSTFSSVGLPFGEVPQSMMDDALFELLQPAVRRLAHFMQ